MLPPPTRFWLRNSRRRVPRDKCVGDRMIVRIARGMAEARIALSGRERDAPSAHTFRFLSVEKLLLAREEPVSGVRRERQMRAYGYIWVPPKYYLLSRVPVAYDYHHTIIGMVVTPPCLSRSRSGGCAGHWLRDLTHITTPAGSSQASPRLGYAPRLGGSDFASAGPSTAVAAGIHAMASLRVPIVDILRT